MNQVTFSPKSKLKSLILPFGILAAILVGWLTSMIGIALPLILAVVALIIPSVFIVFNRPKVGFLAYMVLSVFLVFLGREVGDFPFGYGIEALLILTWVAAIFHTNQSFEWSLVKTDITALGAIWFLITVLELFNPISGSFLAWVSDARYPLGWLLVVPLSMVIFNKKTDLDFFLVLIIILSLVAAFNGVKQLHIGLFPGEQEFLSGPSRKTHILFGKLRVFSFYMDAGQFGASMAQLCVIAFVLALGPFKKQIKIACAGSCLIFLYAMFISGTRGALFALGVGIIIVIIINKNIKIILFTLVIGLFGFAVLKYTYIGHSNYNVYRMRTALNPKDASLNLRFYNQARMQEILKNLPLGAGLGSVGYAAQAHNRKSTYLGSIPPDSYWVKVWANYGIVGFTIWFGMMMYITGKCCGIVWNTKDKKLKVQLTALTAGAAGIIFCSYGNEVMNNMPSSMLVYVSWAFVFLGPRLDRQIQNKELHAA